MHKAIVDLQLITPYCQSRFHDTPKLNKELADDYERRTWRERLHVDSDGVIVVPGMALANTIKEAAKFLSIQVPGKGKATWTKHFEAGISVHEDCPLGVKKEEAFEKRMFVPSNGQRGGGSRVMKSYPLVLANPPIEFSAEFFITDEAITPEVFAMHLQQAGQMIGIGSFRVRNLGVFGQFKVLNVEWLQDFSTNQLPPMQIVAPKAQAQTKLKGVAA